uniref:Capsid protein n=1 Tax=Keturi virus TaxID=2800922 RepID=A0A894KFD1_9VIRU|nr:MAG: capsid protein [Keturi virus]
MDPKKYFLNNKFSKMGDIIGEGLELSSLMAKTGSSAHDASSMNLVELKPTINNPVVGDNMDKLVLMCREMMANIGDDESENGPKIGEMYQAIRGAGTNFRSAEMVVNICNIDSNMEGGKVCRKSEFYESVRQLGAYFFSVKPAKLKLFDALHYKINYAMFSALGKDECKGLGSGQYSVETKIEILARRHGLRREAKWSDWTMTTNRYYNSKCQDIMSETSIKVEDLLTAMLLPRENSSLSNLDMVKLREYLHMGPTSCLSLRFMVLYLIIIRMWHGGYNSVEITTEKKRLRSEEFSTKGISNCINMETGDTVINVVNMTPTEQVIMARSAMGYHHGDFMYEGFDLYMGGFDVPAEIQGDGSVYLLGGVSGLKEKVTVTSEDIYNTMVKYAMRMQACSEMEMGYNLAGNILFADGLPNFSVPRPQGFVDIIATALSKVNTNGYVPPYEISELSMLGFMTLSRQQILMVHDMVTYSETPEDDDPVPVLRVPPETRQAIYNKYQTERFSDAFGLSSVIDPLLLQNQRQVDAVRNIPFPTVAWSSINNDRLVKGTLSEFFWRGEWADSLDWLCLDSSTQKRAKSTFLANGFLIRPVTRGTKVRSFQGIEANGERLRVMPGKVSTRLLDIECVPKYKPGPEKRFQVTPFKWRQFEEEDDVITVFVHEEEGPSNYQLQELNEGNAVYFSVFGGGVGVHHLEAVNNKDHNRVNPIVLMEEDEEQVGGKTKESKKSKRGRTAKGPEVGKEVATGVPAFVDERARDQEPEEGVTLMPSRSGTSIINKSKLAVATTLFGKYLNKGYCKAASMMSRLQHVLGRIAPEAMGLSCALRDSLHMSGIDRQDVHRWQIAVALLQPYLPQLREKQVINFEQLSKMMAFSRSVRNYGVAKKRFNLKTLPSFDIRKTTYRVWLEFMRRAGITITYRNQEMEDVEPFDSGEPLDESGQQLMELTRELKFHSWERLWTDWNHEPHELCPVVKLTETDFNELQQILTTSCAICNN